MSEQELLEKLDALGPLSDEQQKKIVCSLVGHSLIQTHCFGVYNCARCEEQLGDTLVSSYSDAEKTVIVGHDCDLCRKNFENLGWEHKIFTPNPFPEEVDPNVF